jgi:hypothetical protein
MNRTSENYFRNERTRLAERLLDVQREAAALNARRVELDREEKLLTDLLGALDAHVPLSPATELLRIKGAA